MFEDQLEITPDAMAGANVRMRTFVGALWRVAGNYPTPESFALCHERWKADVMYLALLGSLVVNESEEIDYY